MAPGYDDSSWNAGAGPFAYGFTRGPGMLLELRRTAAKLTEAIASLEKEVAVRRTWEFADTLDQWWHDALRDLVAGIEAFSDRDPYKGTIGSVESRLEFARAVRRRSIEDVKPRWDEAIASIQDRSACPKYGGLRIRPQEGLVPIGQDAGSGLWEFAHLQTGRVPSRDDRGKLVIAEGTGLIFVLVPGGKFRMGAVRPDAQNREGSPNVDRSADGMGGPVHEVVLSPFFLSKYEMTQSQWLAFTGKNPSFYRPGLVIGGNQHTLLHPVEHVSWGECKEAMDRLGLTLPTEAQWEYTARAGTTTVWWTGDDKKTLQGAANSADNFYDKNEGYPILKVDEELDDGYVLHAPVGRFRPNAFGLHDVAGNVWEWCRDWYGSYALPVGGGDGERKVPVADARGYALRGGSFSDPAALARSAYRHGVPPGIRYNSVGLRPARAIAD